LFLEREKKKKRKNNEVIELRQVHSQYQLVRFAYVMALSSFRRLCIYSSLAVMSPAPQFVVIVVAFMKRKCERSWKKVKFHVGFFQAIR